MSFIHSSRTCRDTCHGQEWGLAGSPLTMRVWTRGGFWGLPHVSGQPRAIESTEVNNSTLCVPGSSRDLTKDKSVKSWCGKCSECLSTAFAMTWLLKDIPIIPSLLDLSHYIQNALHLLICALTGILSFGENIVFLFIQWYSDAKYAPLLLRLMYESTVFQSRGSDDDLCTKKGPPSEGFIHKHRPRWGECVVCEFECECVGW